MNVSAADICFWGIEGTGSHQAIALYNHLDSLPDEALLQTRLRAACAHFPKLQQRRSALHSNDWEVLPDIDFSYHLCFRQLPKGTTTEALHRLTAEEFSRGLDLDKPLWRIVVLHEPLQSNCVLLYLIHHSLADGMSGMALFYTLCDEHERPSTALNTKALRSFRRAGSWKMEKEKNALLRMLKDVLCKPAASSLQVSNSTKRRLHTLVVDEQRIKAARQTHSLSLNEVFLLAVTSALRSYLLAADEALRPCAALVPVNLREDHPIELLGNQLSAVRLILPVDVASLDEQIRTLRANLQYVQQQGSYAGYDRFSRILARLPYLLRLYALKSAARRIDCICTNAPGPNTARWIAGARINQTFGLPALMHSQGLGFAAIRYAKAVHFSIVTDATLANETLQQSLLDGLSIVFSTKPPQEEVCTSSSADNPQEEKKQIKTTA